MNGMYALNILLYNMQNIYYIRSSFSVISNYAEIEDKDDWSVNTWVVVS